MRRKTLNDYKLMEKLITAHNKLHVKTHNSSYFFNTKQILTKF